MRLMSTAAGYHITYIYDNLQYDLVNRHIYMLHMHAKAHTMYACIDIYIYQCGERCRTSVGCKIPICTLRIL